MRRVDRKLALAVLAAATTSAVTHALPAAAHVGHSTSRLTSGFTHPILGVDHILAMVTVGVLAVTLLRPFRVPCIFLGAMAVGGALGVAGMTLPAGETAIALSVVALGGALVARHTLPPVLAMSLVGVAGFVHGHAHGVEAPTAAHPAIYVIGFLVATAILHFSGVALGFGLQRRPQARTAIGALVIGAGVGLIAGIL